jgi:hypothetical protein
MVSGSSLRRRAVAREIFFSNVYETTSLVNGDVDLRWTDNRAGDLDCWKNRRQ